MAAASPRDEAAAEADVVMVSAAGAKALWPGEDPIGKNDSGHHRITRSANDGGGYGDVAAEGSGR